MIYLVMDPGPLRIEMSTFAASIGNGTSVAVGGSITPVITGGYAPYTYDWTDNMGGVFVQASSSTGCWFRATGTDTNHTGVAILRLIEANGVTTTASCTVAITQGVPP